MLITLIRYKHHELHDLYLGFQELEFKQYKIPSHDCVLRSYSFRKPVSTV